MLNRLNMLMMCVIVQSLTCCQNSHNQEEFHALPDQVGEIPFDPNLDDANFKVCHEDYAYQYYNFGNAIRYEGEKSAIIDAFKKRYKTPDSKDENGYITIRFMVNCEGVTGRFRVLQLDELYNDKVFSNLLLDQIVEITKSLKGWKIGKDRDMVFDYYQYLTFKIVNSQIESIIP